MAGNAANRSGGTPSGPAPSNPGTTSYAQSSTSNTHTVGNDPAVQISEPGAPAKKRRHRAGKKRRNRRQSFAAPSDIMGSGDMTDDQRPSLMDLPQSSSRGSNSFARPRRTNSNTSLESEALLDHREQGSFMPRRQSVQVPNIYQPRQSQQFRNSPSRPSAFGRSKLSHQQQMSGSEPDDDADDRTPLMSTSHRDIKSGTSYGGTSSGGRDRPGSRHSPDVERQRPAFVHHHSQNLHQDDYDVNNPPSVPNSPKLGPDAELDDVMLTIELERTRSLEERANRPSNRSRDALIDIDDNFNSYPGSSSSSPKGPSEMRRRATVPQATDDVCFPHEGMSEVGDHDYTRRPESEEPRAPRRRRRYPDLAVLEAWAHEEKEQRTLEGMRTRKVNEPLMVGGRLRPQKRVWHRDADDAPFRFTYFNENFENTIHSQSLSELVQPGQSFRDLFIPDPPILSDSSDDETDDEMMPISRNETLQSRQNGSSRANDAPSRLSAKHNSSGEQTRSSTPGGSTTPKPDQEQGEKPLRYGDRPAFWLDVLSPTDTEMKVIQKAFGIHPLTTEDILMQEAREKVELFRNYYFINYRSFEQDENSEDYLEPLNIYVVVFGGGVISFHFSMTPHPANVRRRIRQLQDYLVLSPDWVSYAIIDDITDVYAPLIQRIEEEVDEIDDAILALHSQEEEQEAKKAKSASYNNPHYEKQEEGTKEQRDSGRDMLRRVGECRKKVMSLYRLLGNKADVIKGFAKRCNEQWDVAPKNEIGLYLGDIQDHIVTMTGNLSHYENLLSRAHSNYLAQINIRMNERQEKTSDILGRLTVLGTIVLPMNVVTGIWGMNCLVPGQDVESLTWFWCITAGLIAFGLSCYFIAKRIYGIM